MAKAKGATKTETAPFDRESMAEWYARRHLETDTGVKEIYYLPKNAPPREIRFLEVNTEISETQNLEPIDFGVDIGGVTEHKLLVIDVTPGQFAAIEKGRLSLPGNWTLKGKKKLPPAPETPQKS